MSQLGIRTIPVSYTHLDVYKRQVLDIVLCIAFIAVAIGLINKAYIYKKDEMSVKEDVYKRQAHRCFCSSEH